MKHPFQKIKDGRFVENKIVSYLLYNGGIDLNQLARLPFDDEDRMQFAQLIGYSLSGYSELSYVSDLSYDAACRLEENPSYADSQAEIESLTETLTEARRHAKGLAVALFRAHPDDLEI